MSRRWITPGRAAEALDCTPRQVRRLLARGVLVGERRTDGWQVDAESLEARAGEPLGPGLDETIARLVKIADDLQAERSVADTLVSILRIVAETQSEVAALRAQIEAEGPQRSVARSVGCATTNVIKGATKS